MSLCKPWRPAPPAVSERHAGTEPCLLTAAARAGANARSPRRAGLWLLDLGAARWARAGASPMLLGASWLCASKAAATAARGEGEDRQGEQQRGAQARTEEDMDESSLLDLLECSVCLERLDTTAKVLPCQHTFCRRCLESIVCSRHELRCPECRILVGCGVDELPANILLVRLLDGIRQRPRTGASPGSSPPARPGPGTFSALAGGAGGATGSPPRSPVFLSAAAGSSTSSLCDLATNRSVPVAKVRIYIYPKDMEPLCGNV